MMAAAVVTASPARAEDDAAAIDKIVKLNKKAVDEYQNLNFDKARKLLDEALAACTKSGLDNHPVAARTHVHMGVVLFAGFKDKDGASAEFGKAKQIQPDIKLDTALATPEIQEAYDAAAGGGGGSSSGGPAPAEDAITHEPIRRAQQAKSIAVNVTLDSSVKAKKLVVRFSADGTEDFGKRDMQEASPGNWMGEIPSSATEGAKVRYYIEALNDDDQVVARKGSAADPLVVSLRGPGGAALVPPKKKKKTPDATPEQKGGEGPTWFFALGLGSGFGWTTGTGEVNGSDHVNPAGFAWAKLGQIAPQVGYFVRPDLIVSVELRLQLVTGATAYHSPNTMECGTGMVCNPASYAAAGFARAAWLFDSGDLHPFVGPMLGAGTIRHIAEFPSVQRCGSDMKSTCIDTVAAGPIFVGGTGGILYDLTPAIALMAEANAALGFTKFTFNIDLNVGVAVKY
ncbi:MAG TPA: tetratricopeptide repeat protein [Polyangia bacterium]|nr:tetratricopeptide repeat protein [Polyangia bacterium]